MVAMVVAMATTGRRWVAVLPWTFCRKLPLVWFQEMVDITNKNRDLPFGDDSIFRKKQHAHGGSAGSDVFEVAQIASAGSDGPLVLRAENVELAKTHESQQKSEELRRNKKQIKSIKASQKSVGQVMQVKTSTKEREKVFSHLCQDYLSEAVTQAGNFRLLLCRSHEFPQLALSVRRWHRSSQWKQNGTKPSWRKGGVTSR